MDKNQTVFLPKDQMKINNVKTVVSPLLGDTTSKYIVHITWVSH
jgi:hypothetical protein